MPIVQMQPELRYEFDYGGTITVLEGSELAALNSRFYWHNSRQLKKQNHPIVALLLSVVRAYQGLYGKDVVTQAELRDLSTADARKMDLCYKATYLQLCEALYPDDDWESLLYGKPSFWEFLKEVVVLKPNIFGVGVDLNAAIRRLLPRKAVRRKRRGGDGT